MRSERARKKNFVGERVLDEARHVTHFELNRQMMKFSLVLRFFCQLYPYPRTEPSHAIDFLFNLQIIIVHTSFIP